MSEDAQRPQGKTELLERMRAGREEWDSLIAQVPEPVMTEPVLSGGWSVKDLIAHVAAYEKWTAAQIRAANEGRVPTNMELYDVAELPQPEDGEWNVDRQNAAIYEHYRDTPLPDVRAIGERAYADLIAAVENVSAEDVVRHGAQSWAADTTLLGVIPGQSYAHYQQHIDELRTIAGQDVVLDDPSRAFATEATAAAAVFRDEKPIHMSFGEAPGSLVAAMRFVDLLVHAWDVALD